MPSPAFAQLPPMDFAAMVAAEKAAVANYKRPDVSVAQVSIPTQGGRQIPARVYTPNDASARTGTVVWFHGGAFVFGGLDMAEAENVAFELAKRTGSIVVSVDYWLVTDDVRFPVPQQDGLTALQWVIANAARLGATNSKVYVGGASAGACLAGSVALLARDRGIHLNGVLPIYPIAHFAAPQFSPEFLAILPEFEIAFATIMGSVHNPWLIEGADPAELAKWHAFPGDTADQSGQAPYLVIHAELDGLRDSGQRWTQQLRQAGVPLTEHVIPGAMHGFLNRNPDTDDQMQQALTWMAEFIGA